MRVHVRSMVAALAALLASAVPSLGIGIEDVVDGGNNYAWQQVELPGTMCGNGSQYRFYVYDNPNSSNLLISFEGGGACWDYDTCSGRAGLLGAAHPNGIPNNYIQEFQPKYVSPLVNGADPGIPLRAKKDIATKGFDVVYMPYCTGDVHVGNRVVTYTDPANSCANMEKSQDWIQFVLDQPIADAPGAKFVYNSGATELLSYLIKKGTGKQAHEYAAEQLFAPLGISESYWKTTPTGLADTEGGLYLTARDLAKLGYLYLHDGVWDGKRLLPEGWVKASTSPLVDTRPGVDRSRKYGYQWWVLPYGKDGQHAYAALGYGGQRLIVVPEHDLIAVFTGWNIYESPEFAPYDARLLRPHGSPGAANVQLCVSAWNISAMFGARVASCRPPRKRNVSVMPQSSKTLYVSTPPCRS